MLSLNGLKYTVSENAIVIAKDASAVKNLQSEQMKVQGTVKDEKGLPLPGASVYLKAENTLGVTTDIGGHFEFKVPAGLKGKVVLVISFIGMETVELPLDGREHYEISMKPEITSLDDVLITGYQTISRERATGAFDIVDQAAVGKTGFRFIIPADRNYSRRSGYSDRRWKSQSGNPGTLELECQRSTADCRGRFPCGRRIRND